MPDPLPDQTPRGQINWAEFWHSALGGAILAGLVGVGQLISAGKLTFDPKADMPMILVAFATGFMSIITAKFQRGPVDPK